MKMSDLVCVVSPFCNISTACQMKEYSQPTDYFHDTSLLFIGASLSIPMYIYLQKADLTILYIELNCCHHCNAFIVYIDVSHLCIYSQIYSFIM